MNSLFENNYVTQKSINPEILRRFMVCANCLSYKEACEKLGVTIGTLSKQLDEIEEYLGSRLFLRKGKKRTLVLTSKGKSVYEAYDKLMLVLSKDDLNIENDLKKITIKTTKGLSRLLIPKIIKQLERMKIKVKLEVNTSSDLNYVKGNEVLIRSDILPSQDNFLDKLTTLNFKFFCSKEYFTSNDLESANLKIDQHVLISHTENIHFETESVNPKFFTNNLTSNTYVTSDNIDLLLDLCISGKGVLELPSGYPGTEGLKVLKSDPQLQSRSVFWSYNKSNLNDSFFQDFIDCLEQTKF